VAYPRTKEAAVQSKTDRSYQDFMYTYCSWLLAYKKGQSYYHASRDVMGYANPVVPWYDKYDLTIGQPAGGRYRLKECWAREYAGGDCEPDNKGAVSDRFKRGKTIP
jgi:hypothetical protein